ncbi:hypothetical protein UFOVP1090_15 [uncultured Caudovirales phage]|uniref:Uncharacterized protein n=1 Tax=uncultured Caudovirales phage TaxID=2100421 RepID=A0A6J5QE18_9CAUD|nr:hypothetical protein UFOVP1090_15 [uncultured Caudovirales phage]
MNEAKFSSWLMQNWLSGDGIHAQRIETSTASGVPDINFCVQGFEGWIETKVFTPSGKVLLRPYQRAWMHRRLIAKGEIFIVALNEKTNVVHCWLFQGCGFELACSDSYLSIVSPPKLSLVKTSHNRGSFLQFISRLGIN